MKDWEKDQYEPPPSKKAVREELLELNQIFQNITDGVVVIDKEYKIIRMNDTFEKLSGFNKREAMGGIIQAISLTIEKRDPYTAGHQRRVAKLSRAIAIDKTLDELSRGKGVLYDPEVVEACLNLFIKKNFDFS